MLGLMSIGQSDRSLTFTRRFAIHRSAFAVPCKAGLCPAAPLLCAAAHGHALPLPRRAFAVPGRA